MFQNVSGSSSVWEDDPTRTQQGYRKKVVAPPTEAELQAQAYQAQIAGLQGLASDSGGTSDTGGRFAQMRAPQVSAVDVLGARAQSLGGSAAMLQGQSAREAAQARAAGSPSAVLGGAIGSATAQTMPAIEREAAARQGAYLQGLQALGGGLVSEAEARRASEQELLRDMQIRFVAAQRIAAQQRERQQQLEEQRQSALFQGAGAAIGAYFGGPGGAAAGSQAGGQVSQQFSSAK